MMNSGWIKVIMLRIHGFCETNRSYLCVPKAGMSHWLDDLFSLNWTSGSQVLLYSTTRYCTQRKIGLVRVLCGSLAINHPHRCSVHLDQPSDLTCASIVAAASPGEPTSTGIITRQFLSPESWQLLHAAQISTGQAWSGPEEGEVSSCVWVCGCVWVCTLIPLNTLLMVTDATLHLIRSLRQRYLRN